MWPMGLRVVKKLRGVSLGVNRQGGVKRTRVAVYRIFVRKSFFVSMTDLLNVLQITVNILHLAMYSF